jgi:hypothetical protein
MKYSFKILFTSLLLIICNKSFSQNLITETREIQEIKLIFKDFINNKLRMPLYIGLNDTVYLPPYFTSYKEYFSKRKRIEEFDWTYFDHSKTFLVTNLSKHDCDELNSKILNDSNRIYIQNKWFENDKFIIISDTMINLHEDFYMGHMNPIFFRNYTRCFFAIKYEGGMHSFFLKKINNHWVLYKIWTTPIEN